MRRVNPMRDLKIGDTFGKLTVTEFIRRAPGKSETVGRRAAICVCECGRARTVDFRDLHREDRRAIRACSACVFDEDQVLARMERELTGNTSARKGVFSKALKSSEPPVKSLPVSAASTGITIAELSEVLRKIVPSLSERKALRLAAGLSDEGYLVERRQS